MKLFTFLFYTAIAIIAIAIGSQNGQMITVNYLIGEGEFTLSVVIAVSFLTGAVVTIISISLSSLLRRLRPKRNSSSQEV